MALRRLWRVAHRLGRLLHLRTPSSASGGLHAAAPGIADWLNLVFTVMGGFMSAAGALVMYLALAVLQSRPRGAAMTLALVGCVTVGLMSTVNFIQHSDFRWLLGCLQRCGR